MRDYAEEYKELQLIQNQISDFIALDAPDIQEIINIKQEDTKVDIIQLEHKNILQRITTFKLVYQRYGSFTKMEMNYHLQYRTLQKQKVTLQSDIKRLKVSIKLFSADKGLLAKVIETGRSLSEGQEAALLHLLDVHWQKPPEVKKGERFTESLDILDTDNIEIDEQNDGYWLRLGYINEFFPKLRKQLLSTSDTLKRDLKNRIDSLTEMLKTTEKKLIELEQFEQGKVSIISFLEFDADLRDSTSLAFLKQNAIITQGLGQKINFLNSKKQKQIELLQKLAEKIPFTIETNDIKKQYLNTNKHLEDKESRYKELSKLKIREDTKLLQLSEKDLPRQKGQLEYDKEAHTLAEITYHKKENERAKLQIKIEINEQESIHKEAVKKLESSLDEVKTKYQAKYRDISTHFPEASEGNDPEIKEQIEDGQYGFPILEYVLLGPKIKHIDNLPGVLRDNNRTRETIMQSIHTSMLRIFSETKETFENHQSVVRGLNRFFRARKISGKYAFHINFNNRSDIDIRWIDNLNTRLLDVQQRGQLPLGESVESFVEDFFKQVSGYKHSIDVHSLLDPKTYFDVSVSLKDENDKEYSGSTGEAYSAIVLLGIGRLSMVQKTEKKGLRFVILEETANLDQTNFNHFPEIARDFGYQIITMTPQPYGSSSDEGWYLYHLLPSKDHADINSEPLGYFKTNQDHRDLKTYLNALEKNR